MSEETTTATNQEEQGSSYLVPISIVIAGFLVAGAIFATNGKGADTVTQTGRVLEATVLPVTKEDHVFGSRNADVFLIEYSDYRCGYCGRFHDTVLEVLKKYDGRVAWVYRHTPYQPGGKEASVASECVAELAGEDAFWEYTDRALQNQSKLSTEWHLATAKDLGVDEAAFNECVASDRFDALIAEQTMNSQELGGQGTPYNVLLTKKGDMVKFSGAQPIDRVLLFVERVLRSLDA